MILAGDFNLKIKWQQGQEDCIPIKYEGKSEKKFIANLENCFMSQHIHLPTFQTSPFIMTDTLDLIITDTPERMNELIMGPILGKITKAHLTIEFKIKIKQIQKRDSFSSTKYQYRFGNYNEFSKSLNANNWLEILKNLNVNSQYEIFLQKYNEAVKNFIPIKKIESKIGKPKWFNKEITKLIREKRTWNKFFYCGINL